jgi:precorrin-6A/cobalt-precorrin-6A reductase
LVKKRLWLIGGTSESAEIALAIAAKSFPCVVTVATDSARSLYPHQSLKIEVGQLNKLQMLDLCQREGIVAIIDASHPYAVEVSHNAIATATQQQIPYLRYERTQIKSNDKIIELESFETLVNSDYLLGQRVLLTVGYKVLPLFAPWQNRAKLFARILPAVHSLEVALAAGFSSDRLVALRPPISPELELALWRHWQISLVVTKASGKAGGEEIKRSLAAQMNIPLIVIARPKALYPQQTSNISEVLAFCYQHLKSEKESIDPLYPTNN